MTLRSFALALLVLTCACGRHPRVEAPPPPPAPVYAPSLGAVSFTTEQIVEATHGESTHTFRAVVQKEGDRLVIVILTSFGVRAVTLTQEGRTIHVERHLPRDLPFPPEYVAADVARSLVVGLPLPEGGDGTREYTVGDETFRDTIAGGILRERLIRGADAAAGTLVRYDPPGMARDGTPPPHFSVVNAAFGYRLVVTTRSYRPTESR